MAREPGAGLDLLFWAALRLVPDLMTETLLATDRAVVAAASPAEQARVRAIREAILPVSRRRAGLLMDARATTTPPGFDLSAIRAPTLAVSCEDDRFGTAVAARVIAAEVPGAELIVYPDGGHVWVGRNDQLFADIAGFLRRVL
jgi:2-hydroxy-6-oxonona-2,4-dienedioate hydrolase